MAATVSDTPTEKLKKILSAPTPPSFILFLSPDHTRCERFLQKYKQTFPASTTSFSGKDFDKSTAKKVIDTLQSYSLFSDRETVVLSDIDLLTAAQLKVIQDTILSEQFPNSFVMLGTTLPSSSVFLKQCQKQNIVVQLPELKGLELKRWVAKEFKNQGIMSPDNTIIESIIEIGDFRVDEICKKIEIAALYAGEGVITSQDLSILFNHIPEESEFILFDIAVSGHRVKAELLLERLIQSGKSPFGLLAIWARTVGQLMTISIMQSQRKNEGLIRETLGIAPWLYTKLYPLVKKLPLSKLTLIQKQLLKVDSLLKNKSISQTELMISCLDTVYP